MRKHKPGLALLGAFLMSWFLLGVVAAQTTPLSVFNDLAKGYSAGDVKALDPLLADDVVSKSGTNVEDLPTPPPISGKQKVLEMLDRSFKSGLKYTFTGTPQVKGNTVTSNIKIGGGVTAQTLKSVGINQDYIDYIWDFEIENGKVKTITSTLTPESVEIFKKLAAAGQNSQASTPAQGQGGAAVPANVPNSGSGGATMSENQDWLIWAGSLGVVVMLSMFGFALIRRRAR